MSRAVITSRKVAPAASAAQGVITRLTVWRRFENFGLGRPVVILGEEGPGDGWVLCRDARVNLNQPVDRVLVDVAGAFATFGIEYINKVGYLTEVLEDFAAVCVALGVTLPIAGGGWVVYRKDELQAAGDAEYQKMLREIDRVFGMDAAKEQAKLWGIAYLGR